MFVQAASSISAQTVVLDDERNIRAAALLLGLIILLGLILVLVGGAGLAGVART